MNDTVLTFAHIGDLHLTDAKQRNFADYVAIVAQLEIECGTDLDFVVLPGDNADNGLPEQYLLAATPLKMLSRPVHAIPGDHDMEQGGLESFHSVLAPDSLPKAMTVRGTCCLFLDIAGPGSGGPDFQLGADQLAWLETSLKAAKDRGEPIVVFMHSYPDDLKGSGEAAAVTKLFASYDVALVDIGHTHYNEISNDGHTIYAATRSTGQIDEGPVGYSVATFSKGIVSWRFKPLDDAFPLVVITEPADHRLMRGQSQAVEGSFEVAALVMGRRGTTSVSCQVAEGEAVAMTRSGGDRLWRVTVPASGDRLIPITVEARDASGRPGVHQIMAAGRHYTPPQRAAAGSDKASIGAWIENGIFGTQLGPNRNGKPSS